MAAGSGAGAAAPAPPAAAADALARAPFGTRVLAHLSGRLAGVCTSNRGAHILLELLQSRSAAVAAAARAELRAARAALAAQTFTPDSGLKLLLARLDEPVAGDKPAKAAAASKPAKPAAAAAAASPAAKATAVAGKAKSTAKKERKA